MIKRHALPGWFADTQAVSGKPALCGRRGSAHCPEGDVDLAAKHRSVELRRSYETIQIQDLHSVKVHDRHMLNTGLY